MENHESLDLIAAQEQAVRRFAEASPEETLALIAELTATMRIVVQDDGLWNTLIEVSGQGAGQLRQLILVDWQTLLEQWGVPDAEGVALELVEAVTHADGAEGWAQARELLAHLTEMLEGDIREPQPRKPGWLGRMRERAAVGYSALRRIRVGALVAHGGMGIADATVPTLLGAGGTALMGPPGTFLGVAVGGLGVGLFKFLRGSKERSTQHAPSQLDILLRSSALSPYAKGAAEADLEVMRSLSEEAGWSARIVDLLADVRLWAARIGATLAVAWPLVGAHLKSVGLHAVERITVALHEFQRLLRRIAEEAANENRDQFVRGVDRACEAMTAIGESLWELEKLVAHR